MSSNLAVRRISSDNAFVMRFILLLFTAFPTLLFSAAITPEQVVVVVNEDKYESTVVARHYMQARGIPEKNIIRISASHSEEVSWPVFVGQIWNPLLQKLHRAGWLQGEVLSGSDASGRIRLRVAENKIGYLVLCPGIPLRISNNPELVATEALPNLDAAFALTTAAVDSELALLAQAESSASGFISNPFFKKIPSSLVSEETKKWVRVARLDGPSAKTTLQLVDHSLIGEKRGMLGRAYIDQGGPHKQGEEWLQATAGVLQKVGYDTSIESTKELFGDETRFDAPIFYFGWYAANIGGRLAQPDFRFPPGAIALHIHSFSAKTLRSTTQGWVGPLVDRGATITIGNVAEPYLQLTTVPPLLVAGFLQGMQAGEAYAFATPAWSWQTILIGDPLYQPFQTNAAQQMENAAEAKDPRIVYALLRTINQMLDKGKKDDAYKLLSQRMAQFPMLQLALPLAQQQIARQEVVKMPSRLVISPTEDAGLLIESARFFQSHNQKPLANALYRKLVDEYQLPEALKKKLQIEAGFIPPDPQPATSTPSEQS